MSRFSFDPANFKTMYERPWELRMPAFRVFGNLYFVGNKDGASWLVDTGEGLVLFDTNYPHADAMLVDSIWSLGFDPRQIVAIMHTHGHFDHFGATAYLKDLSGAKTYLGEGDVKLFHERPELAHIDDALHAYLELFEPDVVVRDGDLFTFGRTTIRAVACPGHSPGATTYFFPVTDGRRTLTAALHGGAGFNTLCGDYIEKNGVNWRQDFLNSIDKVYEEHVDIFLGNHTHQNGAFQKFQQMTEENDPFIDPAAWKAFLDGLKAQFREMLEEEAAGELSRERE